jgi:hypothetical protein
MDVYVNRADMLVDGSPLWGEISCAVHVEGGIENYYCDSLCHRVFPSGETRM